MLSITLNNTSYTIGNQVFDISIPMKFNGPQPNTYGVPAAKAEAFEGEGFIGDVRRGGSCNFEEFQLIPHCNGTHTECVGHISEERIQIHKVLTDSFIPATLVSVNLHSGIDSGESYQPAFEPSDQVITQKELARVLAETQPEFLQGLIIRTLPNNTDKKSRDYLKTPSPFFTFEAMKLIVEKEIKHLLVDIPSVDRAFDEGRLSTHHLFWGIPQGSHQVNPEKFSPGTITEMIFVDDSIVDGRYLLNLQIAPFMSDAAPSRPRIFPIFS
jgi:arylformamidase